MSETPFSRSTNCRVSDALTYCKMRAVILENELLQVLVLPQKGAEIYSICYKPLDIDPLLHYRPLQTPTPYPVTIPQDDGAFADVYDGGWQVMFPSGGGANSALGTSFGRHGEAALLPWDWQIIQDTPEKVTVRFFVQMQRTPFFYERLLSLESGKAELIFEERVTNLGGEELPFMWGHHPAFGAPFLDGSCVLDVSGAEVESVLKGSPAARVADGIRQTWPLVNGKNDEALDLRYIPENGGHTTDMLFLTDLKQGWFALTNRNLGLGFALLWDTQLFPVLWVWQEFGGSKGYPWYANTYALGLEPCTNYSVSEGDGLAGCIKNHTAPFLQPGETRSSCLRAILYPAGDAQGVREIDENGQVILK